jgi:2-methylcitrate dehydratase PrpD
MLKEKESLTERLVKLVQRPKEAQDRARACLHVLDWLGCAVAGNLTPVGKAVRTYVQSSPAGQCSALNAGKKDRHWAILVNGALGSVLELDDIYQASVLHPGTIVVPAALVSAQAHGASAKAFLDAIISGYEALIRIGRALGPSQHRYYNSATCGAFGAAAAAASVMKLDEKQTVQALGNAGSRTGGFWQMRTESVMTKSFHHAQAASSGLTAAELAACGLTGPRNILEGPEGLFDAASQDASPERVVDDIYEPWMVYDTSFKLWPSARHVDPVIDAVLELREQATDIGLVEEISVITYSEALELCDRQDPGSAGHARLSLQHAAAVALLKGKPQLGDFSARAIHDKRLAALRARVRLQSGKAYDAAYPDHRGAEVLIKLRDGRTYSFAVPDAKGDPENPLSRREIEFKARSLMRAAGMDQGLVEALAAATLGLEAADSLDAFTAALP